MTPQELNNLKVEITTEALRKFIHDLVVTQEEVMFRKKQLSPLYKKKEEDRTEEENIKIRNYETAIERFMEGIDTADERIANFLSIIDAYSDNKQVKL